MKNLDDHGIQVLITLDTDGVTPIVQIDTDFLPENDKGPILKVFLNDSDLYRNTGEQ